MAEHLLSCGAGIGAVPDYAGEQSVNETAGAADTRRRILVDWLSGQGATPFAGTTRQGR
jgi:hypothetical protein